MDLSSINPNTALARVAASEQAPVFHLRSHGDVSLEELERFTAPIPATLKCPEPNLTSLMEDALEAQRRFGMECARNKNTYEYGDEPDTRKLFAEAKRLEAAGESLGEILETTTGVLLVLSRLWLEGALTADEMAAVSKFRSAEMEARNG